MAFWTVKTKVILIIQVHFNDILEDFKPIISYPDPNDQTVNHDDSILGATSVLLYFITNILVIKR